MAGLEQTMSDETMANLPSLMLTDGTTEMTGTNLDDDSGDLFDSTMMGLMTSTQVKIKTDAETQTEHDRTGGATLKKTTLCIEDCKFKDNKGKKKDAKLGPVQCYMCQHWIHPPCVGERDVDIVNIWACPKCRVVPDTLHTVMTMLAHIQEENQALKTLFTDKLNDIQQKMDSHYKKCDKKDILAEKLNTALQVKSNQHVEAINETARLRCKITDLDAKLNSQTWSQFQAKSSQKNIVLGSSLVRDVCESHLENTSVVCIRGGKIKDISQAVREKAHEDSYQQAVLVVGGNDCDPRGASGVNSPSEIVKEYRSLVKEVKSRARSVNVSSVCPRIKSAEVKCKIDAVNAGLQVMCEEEGVIFTDNTPSFHLQDGTVNDGYLLNDGIHLTTKATDRLAQNLKLKLKDGFSSVCAKQKPSQKNITQSRLTDSPKETTDVDTSHAFWSNAVEKARSSRTGSQQQRRTYAKKTDYTHNTARRTDNDTARCYNCYETNHTVKTCRHEHPIICRDCGAEGHKAKHHSY